jgi:ATP-binding cassette subfamily F protein uup
LVLDEPTNDLDIITLNVLEEYLAAFKGCVIVVSHDRYFMDKVVDHLLVFKGQAEIQDFPGNYLQYRETPNPLKGASSDAPKKNRADTKKSPSGDLGVLNPFQRVVGNKLTFKEKRELETLEKEIPELETEQSLLETELSSGVLSTHDLLAKSQRISQLIEELDAKTIRWMELSEKI